MKTIFLDRDGVINEDKLYVGHWSEFEFIETSVIALKILCNAGFQLFIITNQSGIARGFYTEMDYYKLTDKMRSYLLKQKIRFRYIYHCPHLEDGAVPEFSKICDCRKPKPGMILQAVKDFSVDLNKSILIGDNETDILTAKNAGIKVSYLISKKKSKNSKVISEASLIFPDLLKCAHHILSSEDI